MKALTLTVLFGMSFSGFAEDKIQKFIISRDDKHHEAWPYICFADNGDLVCSYSEADVHGGGRHPKVKVRISKDQGVNWSDPILVDELSPKRKYSALMGSGFLMGRWVIPLKDGSLLFAADYSKRELIAPPGAKHNWGNDPRNSTNSGAWFYRSSDGGVTWKGPQKTFCMTVSLTMKQLQDGKIIVAGGHYNARGDYWSQVIYYSTDNGKNWVGPIDVLDDKRYGCAEGDIVEMKTGELVIYLRNVNNPNGAFKMISTDGGLHWEGPFAAGKYRINGRVSAGLLENGDILAIHRVDGDKLGFFIESPEAALSRIPFNNNKYKPTAKKWGIIDVDKNNYPDTGYGGWVQLPNGGIYLVQYITADAPSKKPFIQGYKIPKSFFENAVGK